MQSITQHVDEVIAHTLRRAYSEPEPDGDALERTSADEMESAALRAAVDEDAQGETREVLQRLRAWRTRCGTEAAMLHEEAERLTRRAARYEATAAYADSRALEVLRAERVAQGLPEGERVKVATLDGYAAIKVTRPEPVIIDDEAELPRWAWRQKEPEVNKGELRKRLKAGAVVTGARLDTEKRVESMEWSR